MAANLQIFPQSYSYIGSIPAIKKPQQPWEGLEHILFTTNLADIFQRMSTISISALKKKPARQWLKSAAKDDLVITSKGQPVAVLLRLASAPLESTRALLRSLRALQAQSALQKAAMGNGTADFSIAEVDKEIDATRRLRRRK